jgi:cell division protein FtsL
MQNHKQTKQPLKFAASLVTLVAIVLGLINIFVSNQLSTEGRALTDVNSEIVALDKEIQYLEQQIAAQSALAQIDQQAAQLGFQLIQTPLALNPSERVALVW